LRPAARCHDGFDDEAIFTVFEAKNVPQSEINAIFGAFGANGANFQNPRDLKREKNAARCGPSMVSMPLDRDLAPEKWSIWNENFNL